MEKREEEKPYNEIRTRDDLGLVNYNCDSTLGMIGFSEIFGSRLRED